MITVNYNFKKALLKTFLLIVVLIPFQTLFSQENILGTFNGTVLDTTTNRAIPFVHFTYSNSKGFTTNEKGVFQISDVQKSLLVKVSCIGYQTKYVTISAEKENIIYLDSAIEKLNEVELLYIDKKKELLKKVIANIPKNYPNKKETISGIVREGVFVDSLFQDTIYNAQYDVLFNKLEYSKKRKTGNLSLTKGEAKFYKLKDSIPTIFYGVLHSVHGNDIVMKRDTPLNLNRLDNYKLTIKDTLPYDNLNLIKVAFRSNDLRGNLFIDSKSYVVVKGEYWSEGKTSVIEKLRGFARKERHFSVHYDKYSDDKWRLKFIHFLGKYSQKSNGKTQSFYLKDNFIIRGFEPTNELISHKNTVRFNTPGVLAEKMAVNFSNIESEKFQKKLKIFQFLSKLRFELAIEAYPMSVQPYSFDFPFLEKNISNTVENKKTHTALSSNYFYDISKSLQVEFNYTTSITKNTLSLYSLGASKRIHLNPYGKFNILFGAHIGYRKVFDNPILYSFNGHLTIRGKTFKRDNVNVYVGQKEYFFSPQGSFTYNLSNRLTLSISANYFSPFNSHPTVFIEDAKGLFKKSISYNIESKKIVENKFSYGLGLVLSL